MLTHYLSFIKKGNRKIKERKINKIAVKLFIKQSNKYKSFHNNRLQYTALCPN